MFGFLKDKLKGALGKLTKEVEKDAVVEKKEILVEKSAKEEKKTQIIEEKKEPKKGFFAKIFGKKETEDIIEEKEELRERAEEVIQPVVEEKKIEKKIVQKEEQTPEIKTEEKNILKKSDAKSIVITQEKSKNEIIGSKELNDDLTKKIHKQIDFISTNIPKLPEKPAVKPHFQEIEEKREHKIVEKPIEEHKGFFTKITETFTKIQISEEKFEELFWDLEVVLLENNVAVEVIEKIKRDLKKELMNGKVSRKGVEEMVLSTLRQSIVELFDVEKIDLIQKIKDKRKQGQPYIMAIIGVNGAGKTTSIAKLAHKFQNEGLSVVFAASDTFRAAAIQQLEEHANRLNIKMIKHDYNSDPAAVAFDAIKYAEAHDVDVVMIDTAGRLHSNTNLMRELEKVIRVCKPDIKIFVGESITGNDCVEQAKEFDKAVGIDAIILAKADVDDKGGAAISVSYILQRPILYLGTGQTYDDLKEFDSKLILESLEL